MSKVCNTARAKCGSALFCWKCTSLLIIGGKKKVKWTLLQVLRLCTGRTAHRGSRGIALLFLDHGTRRGEGLASRPDRSLPPGKTRYPLYRRLGGPQGRLGQVRKISPPPGFEPRTVQPVAIRYTDWATRPTIMGGSVLTITTHLNVQAVWCVLVWWH